MKARELFLLVVGAAMVVPIGALVGACQEPVRQPPVTYVPIVRGPEPPAVPASSVPTPFTSGLDPVATPAATPVSVTSADAGAPSGDGSFREDQCFRSDKKTGCCTNAALRSKGEGARAVCPKDMTTGARCNSLAASKCAKK